MAIRSSVTVSLVPEARGGPFVFWDDLPAAAHKAKIIGFDAVELFPPSPGSVDVEGTRALLDGLGLALSAVGTGAGWLRHAYTLTSADPAVRAAAREFVRGVVDAAGALGAPAVVGSMQGRHGGGVDRATALGYLSDALEDLGSHAGQYGVPLLYEPLNRYETNLVNDLAGGLALIGRLSTGNVALLADLFHMNIEEGDIAAALEAAAGHVGHVHFVDSNRRAAGLGHLDFAPVAAALARIGYDRYVSAEALPYPGPDAAAEATMAAFRAFFGHARFS